MSHHCVSVSGPSFNFTLAAVIPPEVSPRKWEGEMAAGIAELNTKLNLPVHHQLELLISEHQSGQEPVRTPKQVIALVEEKYRETFRGTDDMSQAALLPI